jgi:hypothetical protein
VVTTFTKCRHEQVSGGNVADPGAEMKRQLLHVEFKTQEGMCPVCNGEIPAQNFVRSRWALWGIGWPRLGEAGLQPSGSGGSIPLVPDVRHPIVLREHVPGGW